MTASTPSRAAVAHTPWTADTDPDWTPWPGAIQITAADGTVVCWTPSGGNERAYADLIVRAVNIYADTLATLRWVRANYASGSTREINERIDAAISKAERQP